MLKKTITYENPFTEAEVTEEHYFHISKADLVQMEMETHGTRYEKDGQTLTGMQAKLQKIVDAQDGKAIMEELRDIIRRSYGKKEGDRFIKNTAIWEDFSSTEAYSQLIFDLCTDAKAAGDFIDGIIPNNLEKIAGEVRAIAERQEKEGATPEEVAVEAAFANGDRVEPAVEEPVIPESSGRERAIATATPESPITLSLSEANEMDRSALQAGIADGRYKLS